MTPPGPSRRPGALWRRQGRELRDPQQVAAQWEWAAPADPRRLEHEVHGRFWQALEDAGGSLLVSREYEHLLVALNVVRGRRRVSYMRLPHPSGIAVDAARGRVHVASTRNPNMIFDLAPCRTFVERDGVAAPRALEGALLPARCRYLPGSLYLHDLALIGGRLHGNAVAWNAVVEIADDGAFRPVWWPRSIDSANGPCHGRNYVQLNSIAAGRGLRESFFSASAAAPGRERPGQIRFPVDGRGVIFSGRTRAPVTRGLTRPHSARLAEGTLWVANSGYGEFGRAAERFEPAAVLPGWTRGVAIAGGVAFVGTSQVLPRFEAYAPGIDPRRCRTGVHAVRLADGKVLGSLVWPAGNQIFALELAEGLGAIGFPFTRRGAERAVERLFFLGAPAARRP
jgi:uncharacterized protein (TIGR03032 family)